MLPDLLCYGIRINVNGSRSRHTNRRVSESQPWRAEESEHRHACVLGVIRIEVLEYKTTARSGQA